ncbi:putative 4-hydroxybenzoyl-CoA thioesterase [Patulibacter medicamentivorans]|jgi:acyl-CoA thioester hydrolase|uniref:Putative 4-hydroxybenzoyl-CoA thioesterase n=1 Tax=Patulibacter medicamentivorans TaxID=1097667 RepID=H0E5X6_9ACTN|nr:thioesterase family protein [Patulibacter medicamentivorans]EHN10917.1 putative 4-hydroxybenzoyl-CoA thioesterase [Patulibacter medicamentivorans]
MPDAAPPTLADFPFASTITTRWKDNDVYGHVNNVEYYSYFDSAINSFLIREGGLEIATGDAIGVCAQSQCRFLASVSFPGDVRCGVRVGRLGTSSVTYELGLFDDAATLVAEGTFTHVFVDRETRRPVPIPAGLREALGRLVG